MAALAERNWVPAGAERYIQGVAKKNFRAVSR